MKYILWKKYTDNRDKKTKEEMKNFKFSININYQMNFFLMKE